MDKSEFKQSYVANPHKICNPRHIFKNYPDIFNDINKINAPTFKIKLYMYLNDIPEVPKCPICGKTVSYNGSTKQFNKFCSCKCSLNSNSTRTKIEQSVIDHYGVRNPSQADLIKQKKKETCLRNYGVGNPSQADLIKQKKKETCLRNYGFTSGLCNRDKIKQTTLVRYGVENPSQADSIKQKKKETCLRNYGAEYPSQVAFIRQKMATTRAINIKKVHQKIKETCLKRYNCNTYNEHLAKLNNPDVIKSGGGVWICKCPHPDCVKCHERTYETAARIYYDRNRAGYELCTKLLPVHDVKYSSAELEVRSWLDELNIAYDCNRRDLIAPKELDIYLPDYNIAIEINGCYWHSITEKPRRYHIDKYNACNRVGIKLISLWEDWIRNEPIACFDLLTHHLGLVEEINVPWDHNLVDLGLGSGPIKEHKAEHDGFECWDSGLYYK